MCYNSRVGLDSPIAGPGAQFFHPHLTGGFMSKDDSPQDVAPIQEVAPTQDVAPPQDVAPTQDPAFWQGAQACQALVLDGIRDGATGERIHDDLVVSAARIAALDDRERHLIVSSFLYSNTLAFSDEFPVTVQCKREGRILFY
jgi:hypothetical protein